MHSSRSDGQERKQLITTGQSNQSLENLDNNPEPIPGVSFETSKFPIISRKTFQREALQKIRRRVVFKNGDCNILQSRISKHSLRFIQDIFTTLVDIQWRWTFIVFALAFIISWLLFALIWWLIVFTHGDLEDEHLPMHQADSQWNPCILNIHSYTSCFLYSLETQFTTGYGVRVITEECPEAIFILVMQCIIGMIIEAFMTGIIFAKMTRPKLRTQTLLFSEHAVISQRDGQLCLMFRIGDMRKKHMIGASIRALLIRTEKTKEGEVLNNYQTELAVTADGCDDNLFFIWPITIAHIIDEDSPLYHLSAKDMQQEKFEVVVILDGTVESTGQTTQARSSYLNTEILWGYRFESVVGYNPDRQGYEINYSQFDRIFPVDTPVCSGAELAEFYNMQDLPEPMQLPEPYLDEEDIYEPPPSPRKRHSLSRAQRNDYENYIELDEPSETRSMPATRPDVRFSTSFV